MNLKKSLEVSFLQNELCPVASRSFSALRHQKACEGKGVEGQSLPGPVQQGKRRLAPRPIRADVEHLLRATFLEGTPSGCCAGRGTELAGKREKKVWAADCTDCYTCLSIKMADSSSGRRAILPFQSVIFTRYRHGWCLPRRVAAVEVLKVSLIQCPYSSDSVVAKQQIPAVR